jgi:hypothetical protein
MQQVIDYKRRAAECRQIARQMSFNEHRDQLLTMAKDWDRLAAAREASFQNVVRLDALVNNDQSEPPDAAMAPAQITHVL